MTDTTPTPLDPEPTVAAEPAAILPIDPPPAEAEPTLDTSSEIEETSAEILDAELSRLLATPAGMQGAIEALLFTSPEPLSPRKIGRVLGVGDLKLVQTIVGQLQAQYDTDRRGMQIIETAGGYQMATREVFADLVLRLRGRKRRPSLSPAALETLAIVAYRQPIIRAEIEAVRGVESSGMLRNLMDMGLVEIVGRKDVLGRPAMYGTSDSFLQSFGLKNLAELPPIAELKRRLAEAETEAEAEAAPNPDTATAPEAPAPPPAADSASAESGESTTETTDMKNPDQEPLRDDEPIDDQDDDVLDDDEDDVYELEDDEDDFEDEEMLDEDEDDLDEEGLEDDLEDDDFDEDEDEDENDDDREDR
ncbi:SMC-Scp complex subunit ScpB [bacterium]|nr:SMC-Scp complex subunit ScpB [bacterium]